MMNPLGWFGNIFVCLGLWYMGGKKWYAFAFSFLGNLVWAIYAIDIKLWSAACLSLVMVGLSARGLYLWNKSRNLNLPI